MAKKATKAKAKKPAKKATKAKPAKKVTKAKVKAPAKKAKPAPKPKAKPKAPKAPKAVASPPSAPAGFSAEAVAATFGVELPSRYREFLETGEYRDHNERFITGVPGIGGRRQVVFDAPKLLTIFRTNGVKDPTRIPLAAFRGEPELLTIDISDPAGPVGLWDSGAFLRFLPSLDTLLAKLTGDAAPPRAPNDFDEESMLADDGD